MYIFKWVLNVEVVLSRTDLALSKLLCMWSKNKWEQVEQLSNHTGKCDFKKYQPKIRLMEFTFSISSVLPFLPGF